MGVVNNNARAAGKGVAAHQLNNGLYVSGQPDRLKDKGTMMSVAQMPYTGGDIKKSGELGKMLNIPVNSTPSTTKPTSNRRAPGTTTTASSSSHSGPIPGNTTTRTTSGPLNSSGTPWIPGKSAGTISNSFSTSQPQPQPSGASHSGPLIKIY